MNGHFFRPTVLAGDPALDCFREECFAPVVCIAPFDDEADAIAKANASAYALGAAVWTHDVGRAHRVSSKLNAGVAWVNCHHLCGNRPVCRVHRRFFTKSFLGDDAAVLARSSGEEPTSPRHRAGVASMAWRTTRRFSTNAP